MITPVMPTYGRWDLAVERGEGCYLHTTDGRKFLDFTSGIAVTSLGHCHPHLIEALTQQATQLWHSSNLFRIPTQEKLAQRLVETRSAAVQPARKSDLDQPSTCAKPVALTGVATSELMRSAG